MQEITMKPTPIVEFSNYSDCLMGAGQIGSQVVYVYDKEKIIKKLMNISGNSYRECLAFFQEQFLQDMGPRSPVFFTPIKDSLEISV